MKELETNPSYMPMLLRGKNNLPDSSFGD